MDNSLIEDYQERAAEKAREAEDLAAKGNYREAIYRLTDALSALQTTISELKSRG